MEIKHKNFGSNEPKQEVEVKENFDLMSIIELGRVIDKVEICGKVFELRTLNASERLKISGTLGKKTEELDLKDFFRFAKVTRQPRR